MNIFSFKSKKITTYTVIFITVIIGFLMTLFAKVADEAVIGVTIGEMQQTGSQMEILLEDTINEFVDDLQLLAEYVSNNNVDESNIVEFFNSQSQTEEFDILYYINLDGIGISPNNAKFDFSQNESFINALTNDYYITKPHLSFETERIVFSISVPITKNNEVTGVLFSEAALDQFFYVIEEQIEGKGDVFIVDTDLNFIFSSSQNHIGAQIIPEGDASEMGMDNVIAAQNHITAGESGGFVYDYYGISKVMVYTPITMTNWALALNVEVEAFNSDLVKAINYINNMSKIVYWVFIFLIIYIWIYQSNSMRLLEKTAYYDPLTGLPNLTKLKKIMQTTLEKNTNTNYSMLKFDVENFKVVNEIFGFDVGNKVLKAPKLVLERDNLTDVFIARVGVDEYLTFAPTSFLGDIEDHTKYYEDFYKEYIPELGNYNISFKYGRYNIETGETDVTEIINKVTLAHNMAKSMQGFIVYDYNELYKQKLLNDATITRKMNDALDNNEFKVFLQPKFSVKDQKLIGAEALVRWIEPDGTMIFPNDFVPLFEKNGFIVDLDMYILNSVCIMIRNWLDHGLEPVTISVNCSRLNLENPTFVKDIVEVVDRHNVPHKYIEVELTESAAIDNKEVFEIIFAQLREYDFKISIDDFGAGYSSLGLLKNMKVDTLKLDRSFFTGTHETTRGDHVVLSIIKMAHGLDMYVVAEGIETEKQVEVLRAMNCDAVQGYLYSKPLSIPNFEEKYKSLFENKK